MQFSINHDNKIPLHLQIESLLREVIKMPEYINGKLLPKEEKLANELGVSRNTVRHAINKLVMEGLVVRKKGIGSKVVDKQMTTNLENWMSFTQEMNDQGIPFKNYEINASKINADQKLSEIFGIDEGREIVQLERLRGDSKTPFVFFISYFHPRINISEKEDFSQPLYKTLEEKHSVIVKTSKENINAISADKNLAKMLKVKINDPLLFRERFVYDPGNRIVEYNICYYRADKFTYSIEIKK